MHQGAGTSDASKLQLKLPVGLPLLPPPPHDLSSPSESELALLSWPAEGAG